MKLEEIDVVRINNPYLKDEIRVFDKDEYIGMLVESFETRGQVNPIQLNQKLEVMIGGGRYMFEAAKKLNWTTVICIVHKTDNRSVSGANEIKKEM
jgi:ParB-like chromosome segregation protein Spo0J